MESMQSPRVLRDRSTPRHGQGQKECVQSGIVETLAEIAAGGQKNTRFIRGNRRQLCHGSRQLLLHHPTPQDNDVPDLGSECFHQHVQVLGSFGQHHGRTPLANRGQHISANQRVACLVQYQLTVECLKLQPRILLLFPTRPDPSRANDDVVNEGPRQGLRFRINPVADGSALHEDNRMMPVLARHSGR